MITDEELNAKIEQVFKGYVGDLTDINAVVGMIVVGRLTGWKVQRLINSRRCWSLASEHFGDPKELMPERGPYAYKSIGLRIVDQLGGYWDFISRKKAYPGDDRKLSI